MTLSRHSRENSSTVVSRRPSNRNAMQMLFSIVLIVGPVGFLLLDWLIGWMI